MSVSAAVTERLKYQIELACRIQGNDETLGSFVESAVEAALARVMMPRPTGIPVSMQNELWNSVRWEGTTKHFRNADVRNRLTEFVRDNPSPTSVLDEIILWDEDSAMRFFLRAYLASTTLLTRAEKEVWSDIQAKSVVESIRVIYGVEYKSQTWTQRTLESYCLRNWDAIHSAINGEGTLASLPDEKVVRYEDEEKTKAMKGKSK